MGNKEFFDEIEFYVDKLRKDAYMEGYKKAQEEKRFDVLGMKNINFSLANNPDDNRFEGWKEQRMERGFDDTELWNLDTTILKFILPRLREFGKQTIGTPPEYDGDIDRWNSDIELMCSDIEKYINDEETDGKGWELFKEKFFHLWW